jgi:hypothetical protein
VRYNSLKDKHFIGGYYLTKLIIETNLKDNQRPYFAVDIERPIIFFEDLKIAFMTSFEETA